MRLGLPVSHPLVWVTLWYLSIPPAAAGAQLIDGLEQWSASIVSGATAKWAGQRVPLPRSEPRPPSAPLLRTPTMAFHGPLTPAGPAKSPRTANWKAAVERLAALAQHMALTLEHAGWPPVAPDGMRGGGPELDIYLTAPGSEPRAVLDSLSLGPWLDRASVHILLPFDPSDVPQHAPALAHGLSSAVALSGDPAESPRWRRALAHWLTWRLTGTWLAPSAISDAVTEPHTGWVGGAGPVLLQWLTRRFGDPFVRDAWQLARQQTWEGTGLRGSPDLWEAIELLVEKQHGRKLLDELEALALWRSTLSRVPDPESTMPSLRRELSAFGPVPLLHEVTLDQLPSHSPVQHPPLDPLGSAVLAVRADAPGPPSAPRRLRVWLRGGFRVRWSLVATRIGGSPVRDLGHVSSPTRRRTKAYLAVDLTPETHTVLLTATNLSSRRSDEDVPDENMRSLRIIVDR